MRELVEVCAGPSDGPGEEYFCLTACTPAALAEVLENQPRAGGRHWLFLAEFDAKTVEQYLRRAVEWIGGATWAEVAAKIGRLGLWEFEAYRPRPD